MPPSVWLAGRMMFCYLCIRPTVTKIVNMIFWKRMNRFWCKVRDKDIRRGIVILLLKNPDGNQFVSENYRRITISTVISKIIEIVLFTNFENQLTTDNLQFGFKQRFSCSHALFTLKTVVEHYVKQGSTVNIYALDISKAW